MLPDNRYVNDYRHGCEVCGARVTELRRGRCWGCYARWVESRAVGFGARCLTCSDRRLRVLRSMELHGTWQVLCFNCAGQLLQLSPLPQTLPELRAAVSRERRRNDRRTGQPDTRAFRYERRVGERRLSRAEYPPVDDDMIIEVTLDLGSPDDPDFEDLTRIVERIDVLLAG